MLKLSYRSMSRMPLLRFSPLLCLGLAWLMALISVQFLAPIAQNPAFLLFAESGACCGIPHFWNVVTNLVFLWVGGAGLLSLRRDGTLFALPAETKFFIGILLTGHALKHVVAAAAAYCFLRARPRNLG